MSFNVFYPPSGGGSGTNNSIGLNGATAPISSTQVAGENPTGMLTPLQTDASGALITTPSATGVQHVIVDSSALPSGASTSAKQDTGNASLASIDSKLNSPILVTGPLTDTELRASAVPVSAANLPLPTGAATSANQVTAQASLTSIDSKLTSPLSVTGPLTDTELRATPVPVSVSGTATISGTVTANAGTNLNTSALNLETTQSAINAKLPATLGQKTSAASLAVVLASDQSSIPVAATLSAETTKVIGTVNISAGQSVSLAANQSVNVNQIAGTSTSVNAGSTDAGTQRMVSASGPTATTANVNASASSVTLLASSTSRLGATFYNDSTANLYLKFGATASTTSFTVLILSNGYYELPGPHIYNGIIDGIWSAANGAVRVTSW